MVGGAEREEDVAAAGAAVSRGNLESHVSPVSLGEPREPRENGD